jgi:SAM-dependent methyltransferase
MANIASRADRDTRLAEGVLHREDEYDSRGFELLHRMQASHFWYRGRHRFLLHAVHRSVLQAGLNARSCRVVDVGGGCGGWVEYFLARRVFPVAEIMLADSSEVALRLAADFVPTQVQRQQVDLADLPWSDRWDIAFLLDVLEHLPDHENSLRQIHKALAPGGLLFITVPALRQFWTWNDEFCRHQRRYDRADIDRLAADCGFHLLDTRYFMFFLSPMLLTSRLASGLRTQHKSEEQRHALAIKMHAVPHPLVNLLLTAIFGMETPFGHYIRFPWGTSLLAVLQKPLEASLIA